MMVRALACIALGTCLVAPSRVYAQWTADPAVNTPVAIGPGRQYSPGGIPDGAGGAFIAWNDDRNSATTGNDLWVQHLSSDGVRLWGASGVSVASIPGNQLLSSLLPTGDGGVLVAWNTDETFPPPRVQRLDANGAPLWGATGVAVTAMAGQHINARLLAASSGDAFVTWSTSQNTVMAQRLSADGQRLWGDDGVVVCTSLIPQGQSMVPDGTGGMIVGWLDWRNPSYGNVYAQRVDASGATQWATNGVPVVAGAYEQALLHCVEDATGGMLLVWQDDRSTRWHVYAQRLGPDGAELWSPSGVAASTNTALQNSPGIVSAGAGGALAAWTDSRSGHDAIFVQCWNASGARVWGDAGVPAGSISSAGMLESPVSDGHGGIIVGWAEARGIDVDIFAQRVRTAGQPSFHYPEKLWGANGVVVSSASGQQYLGGTVTDGVSPDVSGAIFFWQDLRSDAGDIYAQHVQPSGILGPRLVSVETQSAPPRFALALAGPQPCRTEAALRLDLPADGNLDLVVLDLQGRRVRSLMRGAIPTGTHPVRWDLRDENGSRVASGVYFASAQWRDERAGQRIVVLP